MINPNEQIYLNLLRDIMQNGIDCPDRTGVGVRKIISPSIRYDLSKGFPLWTTRKLSYKTALSEMLWMLEGSGDERRLAELRWGKPRSELTDKTTVWTANAQAPYWKPKARFEGDLGVPYGVMWRHWPTKEGGEIDQVERLLEGMKRDPHGRRHILTCWNPAELDNMALPPCHHMVTFTILEGKLHTTLHQRSNDVYLGTTTNCPEYAILTHMLAQILDLEVGYFTHQMVDAHIYHNHFDAVEEQLSRTPNAPPHLWIDPTVKNLEDFAMDSFDILGYDPYPAIKAPMAV